MRRLIILLFISEISFGFIFGKDLAFESDKSYNFSKASSGVQNNFDYLLLSLQWIPTKCKVVNSSKCKDQWGIHGLWPSSFHGIGPMDCPGPNFDQKIIPATLKKDMDKFWPSIGGMEDPEFWKHEYEKHGRCASSIPQMKNQNLYLRETIDQSFHYATILKLMSFINLKPTNQGDYNLQDVHHLIEGKFGLKQKVIFTCINGRNDTADVSEIRICLNKQLRTIDCQGNDQKCKKFIHFPSIK